MADFLREQNFKLGWVYGLRPQPMVTSVTVLGVQFVWRWPMAHGFSYSGVGLWHPRSVSITALKKTNEKPSYALMPDQFVWRWHSGISLWNGHPRGWPRVALVNVHGAHDHCPSLHLRSSI